MLPGRPALLPCLLLLSACNHDAISRGELDATLLVEAGVNGGADAGSDAATIEDASQPGDPYAKFTWCEGSQQGTWDVKVAPEDQGAFSWPPPDQLSDAGWVSVDVPGCEELLKRDALPTTLCNYERHCSQWREAGTERAHIGLSIASAEARSCVAAFAAQAGVEATSSDFTESVSFDATYAEAAPLIELDVATYIDVGCPYSGDGAGCPHCASLGPAECRRDARCFVYGGARLDYTNSCFEKVELGCLAGTGCINDTFPILHRSPEGDCYFLTTGCVPPGFTTVDQDDCPPR